MSEYHKLIKDDINYALKPSFYLEQLKKETNKEKRFNMLKKYFTEKITQDLYQNMDLLFATTTDFEQFKKMYLMIARDLFMNTLLAVDTLVEEKGNYQLDLSSVKSMTKSNSLSNEASEYSIVESYMSDSFSE
jgi:hypothetical protein